MIITNYFYTCSLLSHSTCKTDAQPSSMRQLFNGIALLNAIHDMSFVSVYFHEINQFIRIISSQKFTKHQCICTESTHWTEKSVLTSFVTQQQNCRFTYKINILNVLNQNFKATDNKTYYLPRGMEDGLVEGQVSAKHFVYNFSRHCFTTALQICRGTLYNCFTNASKQASINANNFFYTTCCNENLPALFQCRRLRWSPLRSRPQQCSHAEDATALHRNWYVTEKHSLSTHVQKHIPVSNMHVGKNYLVIAVTRLQISSTTPRELLPPQYASATGVQASHVPDAYITTSLLKLKYFLPFTL